MGTTIASLRSLLKYFLPDVVLTYTWNASDQQTVKTYAFIEGSHLITVNHSYYLPSFVLWKQFVFSLFSILKFKARDLKENLVIFIMTVLSCFK